jgi:hypothetical protein
LNPKVTSKKIRDGESRVRAIVFSAAFRSFRGVKKLPRSFLPPVLADFYPRRATRAGPIFREPIFFFCEREREREREGKKESSLETKTRVWVTKDDVSIFDLVFFLCVVVC